MRSDIVYSNCFIADVAPLFLNISYWYNQLQSLQSSLFSFCNTCNTKLLAIVTVGFWNLKYTGPVPPIHAFITAITVISNHDHAGPGGRWCSAVWFSGCSWVMHIQETPQKQLLNKDIGVFKLEHFEFGHQFLIEVKYSWRVSQSWDFEIRMSSASVRWSEASNELSA